MHRRHFLVTVGAAVPRPRGFASQASLAADSADAVVQAYLAAWNAHDSAKAAGYFADNVVYYDASVGKPIEGRDAAKTGVIDNFLTAVPDAGVDDEGRAGRCRATGSPSSGNSPAPTPAPGPTAPPRPASISRSPAHRCSRVKDGKIVTQSDYYDALGFYKQLGLM